MTQTTQTILIQQYKGAIVELEARTEIIENMIYHERNTSQKEEALEKLLLDLEIEVEIEKKRIEQLEEIDDFEEELW